MEELIKTFNLVIYLTFRDIKVGKKDRFNLGGHGYTYDVAVEGKKKLVKDTPTSSGYYAGNNQKGNTVVNVADIVSFYCSDADTKLEAMLRAYNKTLEFTIEAGIKNTCIIGPLKALGNITSMTDKSWDKFLSTKPCLLGKYELNETELGLITRTRELLGTVPKGSKILFDLITNTEGGLGIKNAYKQLEIAEVECCWCATRTDHFEVKPKKEYEEPFNDFNKIVSASRWFFDSSDPKENYLIEDGYRVYDFGKVEKDKSYYGKITPDVTYSKLYTKTPITTLDKVYEFTRTRISNKDGLLSAGDLLTVNSRDVIRLIDNTMGFVKGNEVISPVTKVGGKPVLTELISPVLMSYRVKEDLFNLSTVRPLFEKRDENNESGHLKFYNITDLIYTKETNKKGVVKVKVHKDFGQTTPWFKIAVEHKKAVKPVKLTLSVGFDLPLRNSFSSVEAPEVEVWVAVDTHNDAGIRYCSLVKTDDFTYVHVAPGSNLKVLSLSELGVQK